MPAQEAAKDWRKGNRRVHFVSGDSTRVADPAERPDEAGGEAEERRRRRWLLQEIYASAAGIDSRVAKLAKAGFPSTLKEALGDDRLMSGKLPRWTHVLPPAGSLPGEDTPLQFESGRAEPVTRSEALGLARRRRRREIIEQYAKVVGDRRAWEALVASGAPATAEEALSDPEQMMVELPDFNSRKALVNLRFPPALKAMADAACELAGTNFTTMTEVLWWRYLRGVPMGPSDAEDANAEYLLATVAPERDEDRKKKEYRPRRK